MEQQSRLLITREYPPWERGFLRGLWVLRRIYPSSLSIAIHIYPRKRLGFPPSRPVEVVEVTTSQTNVIIIRHSIDCSRAGNRRAEAGESRVQGRDRETTAEHCPRTRRPWACSPREQKNPGESQRGKKRPRQAFGRIGRRPTRTKSEGLRSSATR